MDTSHVLVRPALPTGRPWRRLAFAAALAAGCLASATVRALDDPPGRVGRVADIAGDVRTLTAEGGWMDVVRNQVLSTGDRITTDKTGRATLQLGSTVVRLGADSDLVVTQLDDQHMRLRFEHGQLAVRVRSEDIPGELFIDTDEGAWVPHHAGQYRFDRVARQPIGVQAWSGDLLLEAPDSSLPLKAPQRAEVWRVGAQQTTHEQHRFVRFDLSPDVLDGPQGLPALGFGQQIQHLALHRVVALGNGRGRVLVGHGS